MNKFLALAITTLAAAPIVHPPVAKAEFQAKKTVCTTAEHVADAGYVLTIAKNHQKAVLEEDTIAGPRKVADMDCRLLPVTNPNVPDMIHNYLFCRDARAAEGGLVARVYSGGFAGLHYASVREVTVFRGRSVENEVQFGRLNCRY